MPTPPNPGDYGAICGLEARYARCWDGGDAAGWAGCFTPDGVFEVAGVGDRAPSRSQGRAALERRCADFTARFTGLHLMGLPDVTVDGDTAEGHLHFHFVGIGRLADDHSFARDTFGRYHVRYRRTAEGWRIDHRIEKPFRSQREEHFDY